MMEIGKPLNSCIVISSVSFTTTQLLIILKTFRKVSDFTAFMTTIVLRFKCI